MQTCLRLYLYLYLLRIAFEKKYPIKISHYCLRIFDNCRDEPNSSETRVPQRVMRKREGTEKKYNELEQLFVILYG